MDGGDLKSMPGLKAIFLDIGKNKVSGAGLSVIGVRLNLMCIQMHGSF